MNRSEYAEYELEEIVKKREKLKLDYEAKNKEHIDAVNNFDESGLKEDIEKKKEFLQTLQERQKKELDELKERHKLEREGAQWDYQEAKGRKSLVIGKIHKERDEIRIELNEVRQKGRELRKEISRLSRLKELSVTSHAIIQYLDRAKCVNINSLKKEVREARDNPEYSIRFDKDSYEVPDHELVDFLVLEGRIEREVIEKEVVPDKIKKLVLSDELMGSTGTYTRRDGFRIVVKNSAVVTFLPKADKPKKRLTKFSKKVKRKPRKMKL